jgi:hypothetical protein
MYFLFDRLLRNSHLLIIIIIIIAECAVNTERIKLHQSQEEEPKKI